MVRVLISIFLLTLFLQANIGKVVAIKGDATVLRDTKTIKLKQNSQILSSDTIKTSKNSKIQLLFKDNTIITIGKNALFKVKEYKFNEKKKIATAKFSLLKGTFRTITGKIGKLSPKSFKLNTKSASIGIRGTQILVDIQDKNENIYCTQGQIKVSSLTNSSSIILDAGEYIALKTGGNNNFKKSKFSSKKIKELDKGSKFNEKDEDKMSNDISVLSLSINTENSSNSSAQSTSSNNNAAPDIDKISALTQIDKADNVIVRDAIGFISSENFGAKSFKMNNNDLEIYGVSSYVMTFLTFTNQVSNVPNSGHIDLTYKGNFKSSAGTYNILSDTVSNDDVIWGKWNITDGSSLSIANEEGYIVYGDLTSTSELEALTKQDTIVTYTGDVEGHNQNGSAFATGTVNIDINFNKDSVDADFSFDSQNYNISGTDSDITDGYYIQDGDDKMKGDFYGTNARTTAGSFAIKDGATSYSGVYQAGK